MHRIRFDEIVIEENHKLTRIMFRRNKPEEKEMLYGRRITNIRTEFGKAVSRVVKLKKVLGMFIEVQAQARRDKAIEELNQERNDRLLVEIEAAHQILERLPQAKREGLLLRLRAVQAIPATLASQERFASEVWLSAQSRAPARSAIPESLVQHLLGTPNFDQRALFDSPFHGPNQDEQDVSVAMDVAPISPTLPTVAASPIVLGPRRQPPSVPQPPEPPRTVPTPAQADAMAIQVEKLSQQRIRGAEQYKTTLAQRDVEMEETKARYKKEAAQREAEHQGHLKRMEDHFAQIAATQHEQDQRDKRDQEVQQQQFQA